MTDHTRPEIGLHVVPDPDDDASLPPVDGTEDVDAVVEDDPLLARAQRIAELPLAERPAAFDSLNRALVSELQTLEEG